MANPEHLKILRQGAKVWSEWRTKHEDVWPDLSGADLRGADLRGLNLSQADLNGVDLLRADLTFAYLARVDLSRANFSEASLFGITLISARLIGAKFNDVDFSYADLNGADLRFARLSHSNLNNTGLDGADFTDAVLDSSSFMDNDLRQVKGLETVVHKSPSSIGIDTIYRSRGEIPEVFLRGCGVPDEFITYMRSLVVTPIQFYSCFISYSSKDQDFADRLYADLQSNNVRCWFAHEDLKIGDRIRDRIDESIRLRDKLLLILSESSIASEWVEHEVESALEEERRKGHTILFPIRIDDAVMESGKAWAALIRRSRNIGDFTGWKNHDSYQKAFSRLLRDLKAGEQGEG
jgi:hypothetical protein